MAFRPVDARQSFPELEERILERWRERDVFQRSLAQRADAEVWSFYEGPPTANGQPGSHHVLSRVFKDIYPRYRTMRGYRVPRKAGWDCHGLPVELEVERELGISLEGRDRGLRHRRVQRALPGVRVSLRRGVGAANRADRLLDRPRRRLRDACQRHTSSRCGGRLRKDLGRRAPVSSATRWSRTARAAGRRSPRTRWPRDTTTSRTPPSTSRLPGDASGVPARAGRRPAGLDDDSLDADLERRGGRRPARSSTRALASGRRGADRGCAPLVEKVLGEGAEVLEQLPRHRAGRARL